MNDNETIPLGLFPWFDNKNKQTNKQTKTVIKQRNK